MAYRVQNHAVDLFVPVQNDAIFIMVNTSRSTTCTHVPRQIPKEGLIKLLPKSWVTTYEKYHQSSTAIQLTEPSFKRNSNGTVDITFKREASLDLRPQGLFSAPVMMIQPVNTKTSHQSL